MGVRGLQTYLNTNCREAIVRVDIKEMAKDYQSSCDKDPVIVVDGNACVRKLYSSELAWIYGGQWGEYIENLQKFVCAFEKVNIKLVFIFDGCVPSDKRKVWISRKQDDIKNIKTILDIVKNTERQPSAENFMVPTALSRLTPFALKYKCGSEVHFSTEEADKDIFEFAESNQCLAILSQDTDFLIYDTVPYLSLKELNIDTLKTVRYDRNILAESLGLAVKDLPVFASLVGNDIISSLDLEIFHFSLINKQYRRASKGTTIMLSAARFINQMVGNRELKDVIPSMTKIVFRNEDKEQMLWASINSYCKNELPLTGPSTSGSAEILKLAYDRHINCDNQLIIYNILKDFEFYSGIYMEYDGRQDIPSVCAIMQPVRQRLYGLLLGVKKESYNQTEPDDMSLLCRKFDRIAMTSNPPSYESNNTQPTDLKLGVNAVKEWCVGPDNPRIIPNIVPALPVDLKPVSANLNNLLSPSCEVGVRWRALLACVDFSDISWNEIQQINTKYVVPVLLLHFLCTSQSRSLLSDYELDAFLSHTLTLPTPSDIKRLHVEKVDGKAVKLASLFIGGVIIILCVLGACNYPILHEDALPWNYFDGKFFHHKYLLAKRGVSVDVLCNNDADVLKEFHYLKNMIQNKPATK